MRYERQSSIERCVASDIGLWHTHTRTHNHTLPLIFGKGSLHSFILLACDAGSQSKKFLFGRCWLSIVMRWHFGRKYEIWNSKCHRSSFAHRKTKASIAAEQWTWAQITIRTVISNANDCVTHTRTHTRARKMYDVRRFILFNVNSSTCHNNNSVHTHYTQWASRHQLLSVLEPFPMRSKGECDEIWSFRI